MELRLLAEPQIRIALKELYGLDLDQIRSERPNDAGKFDTAYGGVVVEFEWAMTGSGKEHGAQQALDYLEAERDRLGEDAMFTAVVFDGRQWGFLISDTRMDPQLELFADEPLAAADRFVWQANSVAACRRFLEIVGSHPKTAVSAASLSAAFGSGSVAAQHLITVLVEHLSNRDEADLSDTFYGEWRRALEVAYGSLDTEDDEDFGVRAAYGLTGTATLGEVELPRFGGRFPAHI